MASFFDSVRRSLADFLQINTNDKRNLRQSINESGFNFNDSQLNALTENAKALADFANRSKKLQEEQSKLEQQRSRNIAELDNLTFEIDRKERMLNAETSKSPRLQDSSLISDLRKELIALNGNREKEEAKNQRIVDSIDRVLNDKAANSQDEKELRRKFESLYNMTSDEIEDIFDNINQNQLGGVLSGINRRKNDEEERRSHRLNINSFRDFNSILSKATEGLGSFGVLIANLTQYLINANDIFVKFNRQMSMGMTSATFFNSDLYGNDMDRGLGNIKRQVEVENLDFNDFLNTFKAFSKGNTLGSNFKSLSSAPKDMIALGKSASLLTKQYDVDMSSINEITERMFYTYGKSVTDINEILRRGRVIANQAGVSVKGYFNNLKEATDAMGDYYIAGGTAGLEQLALAATKLGTTTKQLLGMTDKYKDFSSQFEIQGKSMALGMKNFSAASRQIWALTTMGKKDQAAALELMSQLQDFRNMGGFDSGGNLNQVGIRTSQSLGLSKDQIDSINRLNKKFDDLGKQGFSLEEIVGIKPLDPKKQQALDNYERQNMTVNERFNVGLSKLTKAFEGLEHLITPLVDGFLDVWISIGDVAGVIGDILTPGFKVLGGILKWVVDIIKSTFGWLGSIRDYLKPLTDSLANSDSAMAKFGRGLSALAAAMLTGAALKKFGNFMPSLSSLGNLLGRGRGLGSLIGSVRGMSLGSGLAAGGGGGLLSNAAGLVSKIPKGAIWGTVASLVGKSMGGSGGEAVSSIGQGAAIGAMIGSIVPGLGTAIGGIVGGVGGLLYAAGDKIGNIWEQENLSTGKKIGASLRAVWDTLTDAITSLGKWIWDKLTSFFEWITDPKAIWESVKGGTKKFLGWMEDFGRWQSELVHDIYEGFNDDDIQKAVEQGVINGTKEANDKDKYSFSGNITNANKLNDNVEKIMKARLVKVSEGQATAEREERQMKAFKPNIVVQASSALYGPSAKAKIAAS